MSVKTCPKCDALIVPQLARCRRCGTFLHGTRLEGALIGVLPEPLRSSPGTALIALSTLLYYTVMGVIAGLDSLLSFSGYSLVQLGATHGPSILRGEYWRFVTSNFVHHNLIHLAFNMYALSLVGPIVERIFDRKKMLLLYLAAGVLSMIVSHVYYVEIAARSFDAAGIFITSGGASGAVCGLIGAAWVGAARPEVRNDLLRGAMQRWALLMLVFGLFVPGINNAAHIGGFVVGGVLAWVIPVGLTQTVTRQRWMSLAVGLALLVVATSWGAMVASAHGLPGSLDRDGYPNRFLGFTIRDAATWEHSDQVANAEACNRAVARGADVEMRKEACELAVRSAPYVPELYETLAEIQLERGATRDAETLRRIAARVAAAY